jgi:hypothetical protein
MRCQSRIYRCQSLIDWFQWVINRFRRLIHWKC